tara:strand:- start:2608 stop:3060 length:453 start_codon:yes stop_codon:yes gene_type:complete
MYNTGMKAITALLLTCSLSFGEMSIFEKTEDALHPHKDNKEQFNKEYINLLRKNPLQKKEILQAVVLSFDLTKDQISKLIDFTYPSFPRKVAVAANNKNMYPPTEGGDEKGGGKEVLAFPVFPRPQNPLDVLTFPPVDYPPVTTPPSATD